MYYGVEDFLEKKAAVQQIDDSTLNDYLVNEYKDLWVPDSKRSWGLLGSIIGGVGGYKLGKNIYKKTGGKKLPAVAAFLAANELGAALGSAYGKKIGTRHATYEANKIIDTLTPAERKKQIEWTNNAFKNGFKAEYDKDGLPTNLPPVVQAPIPGGWGLVRSDELINDARNEKLVNNAGGVK